MRTRSVPASPLYPKIRFAFTDHPITVWAGAILLRLYVELIGLRGVLVPRLLPFAKTSHNQLPAVNVLLAWWYGLALGAERFEHMTRYRRDPLLPRLLGLPRFPSPEMLPAGHQFGLVRADGGFCVTAFLRALKTQDLPYIIVARLTPTHAQGGDSPDSRDGLAAGRPRHRGRRYDGDSTRLARAGSPVCLPGGRNN